MDEKIIEYVKSKYNNVSIVISIYTMRIIAVDSDFAKKLGYETTELIGKSIKDLVDLNADILMMIVSKFVGHSKSTQTLKTKSGGTVTIEGNIYHITFEGEEYVILTDAIFDLEKTHL